DSQSLDEELRLMYVALTRAKNLLYISYPIVSRQRSYDDYMSNPSRFLQKLPEDLYERIRLIEELRPPGKLSAQKKQLGGKKSASQSEETDNFNRDDLPF
ncbi:MAG: ATP-dependent helicase, partial [Chlorobiales bacterium]|nr:ATP-dependent helicase [Chlorobiales bacterium]